MENAGDVDYEPPDAWQDIRQHEAKLGILAPTKNDLVRLAYDVLKLTDCPTSAWQG